MSTSTTEARPRFQRVAVIYAVRSDKRGDFDKMIAAMTAGMRHSSGGVIDGEAIELDAIEERLIDGLSTARGGFPIEEHEADFAAWNAARCSLGGEPYPRPAPWLSRGEEEAVAS